MAERIPILLDTDPGSDIDDALAIAYLCRQPRAELLGITTVTGDTNLRAGIAEVVCRAYGREDVPIVAGARRPLGGGPGQPAVPHYAAIENLQHRRDYAPEQAVDFLRSTIRSRPDEVVLLSIGPLTNVALLFALDPEIPSMLRGFVSMAGAYFSVGYPEWNSMCDPTATDIVLRRSIAHTLVGLDVTLRCVLSSDEVRARFSAPPHNVVLPMANKWFEAADKITFHDPLAAALIFEPSLCTMRTGLAQVTVTERPGTTHFVPGEGPHSAAETVEVDSFVQHYFEVLGSSATRR